MGILDESQFEHAIDKMNIMTISCCLLTLWFKETFKKYFDFNVKSQLQGDNNILYKLNEKSTKLTIETESPISKGILLVIVEMQLYGWTYTFF